MGRQLKTYFPEIWDREELLKELQKKRELSTMFHKWEQRHQEEFLDFCTGVRGIKLMYDGFFKEIFNPEYVPERLEEVLSLLLKMKVRIYKVLPNDSTRLADESSLLITDIIVELEDGSLVNIEVQKIGYHFPGQRSACYSADMLLRQYKRIRGIKKNLTIAILKMYISSYFLKKVHQNFDNTRKNIFTIFLSNQIQDWKWNCFKNFSLFHLTFFMKINKIKLSKISWMPGCCSYHRMSRKIFLGCVMSIQSFGQCIKRHIRYAGIWRMLWDFFQKNFEF